MRAFMGLTIKNFSIDGGVLTGIGLDQDVAIEWMIPADKMKIVGNLMTNTFFRGPIKIADSFDDSSFKDSKALAKFRMDISKDEERNSFIGRAEARFLARTDLRDSFASLRDGYRKIVDEIEFRERKRIKANEVLLSGTLR